MHYSEKFICPALIEDVKQLQCRLKLLDEMIISASELNETTVWEETLEEIQRKQNVSESLTNIHDKVFEFFETLEHRIRALLCHESLSKHRKHVFKYAKQELTNDEGLHKSFYTCYCYVRTATPVEEENADQDQVVSEIVEKLVDTCSQLEIISNS